MIPQKIVHLFSGGLDSTILLADLIASGCSPHCLLVDYGQRHGKELEYARRHCLKHGIPYRTISIPDVYRDALRKSYLTGGDHESVVVPNRNAVLISIAVARAMDLGANSVTIGVTADDFEMFPDCRDQFISAMNAAAKYASSGKVEVCAPYLFRHKSWIAGKGRELGVNFDETWSCYAGNLEPCNECVACKLRKAAVG